MAHVANYATLNWCSTHTIATVWAISEALWQMGFHPEHWIHEYGININRLEGVADKDFKMLVNNTFIEGWSVYALILARRKTVPVKQVIFPRLRVALESRRLDFYIAIRWWNGFMQAIKTVSTLVKFPYRQRRDYLYWNTFFYTHMSLQLLQIVLSKTHQTNWSWGSIAYLFHRVNHRRNGDWTVMLNCITITTTSISRRNTDWTKTEYLMMESETYISREGHS